MISGTVVFLVALPLCLGVAIASGADAFSGLLAGIVGGLVVGVLSGSHTSVSGPAAGLTAIIAMQITLLGQFETLLMAVVVAGVIQIGLGALRAGLLSAFFPSAVIKGLLAAIGVILILKQIPHLLGHDSDPEGDMAFQQPDHHNTFTEFLPVLRGDIHLGALTVGLTAIAILVLWDRIKPLKKSILPAPLVAVLVGVGLSLLFKQLGGRWAIGSSHLVQVPDSDTLAGFLTFLKLPDFTQLLNPAMYRAALTIAIVASLESLLNLEAVDKLDPKRRNSPPNRELFAQGVGNICAGMIGGIPVTSVIVRSSVNINAGAQTKFSAIFHGLLLLVSVVFLPDLLNYIPISALAAILLVTGFKLASPKLLREMWNSGVNQFLPFVITVAAIVLTDLLVGILIGLAVSLTFILNSNLRRPLRRVLEKHLNGEVLRIELASQVSFLNRARLEEVLMNVPRGGHVLLDAHRTDYIDPDIVELIRDFRDNAAPVRGVKISLRGFRDKYQIDDHMQFVDYSSRELQRALCPQEVLQLLKDGNERFRTGQQLTRDWNMQLVAASKGQHPLAVVLSCMDSRTPVELVFDMGLGDLFSVRMAGNVSSRKVLGSLEYGVAVAGARLILVMGHTQCGAVSATVRYVNSPDVIQATGCEHLPQLVQEIEKSCDPGACANFHLLPADAQRQFVDDVAAANVRHTVASLIASSRTIRNLVETGEIAVVGAMYDVATGQLQILDGLAPEPPSEAALPQTV
jgi:carbonic anhydrase